MVDHNYDQESLAIETLTPGTQNTQDHFQVHISIYANIASPSTHPPNVHAGFHLGGGKGKNISCCLRLWYIACSLIIHELLLLFVSSTTHIFMNYVPNMKV